MLKGGKVFIRENNNSKFDVFDQQYLKSLSSNNSYDLERSKNFSMDTNHLVGNLKNHFLRADLREKSV